MTRYLPREAIHEVTCQIIPASPSSRQNLSLPKPAYASNGRIRPHHAIRGGRVIYSPGSTYFAMHCIDWEEWMKRYGLSIFVFCFALAIFAGNFARAQQPPPPDKPPASVAGKWTLYCNDPNGSTSSNSLIFGRTAVLSVATSKDRINQAGWKALLRTSISWFAPRRVVF